MTIDYSKKKNDELQDLLKARSLPHTGKKAEMVARLQQYDTEQAAKAKTTSKSASDKPEAPTATAEDEIDWEDDAAAATTEAGAAAIAAGGLVQPPNPTAVPNQVVDTDPSQTKDLKVDPPKVQVDADATDSTKPPQDFSSNIPTTTVDAELEKRKARAARFGMTESNDDALKALERAKKFGTDSAADKPGVKGLDEALPERRPKRGRGGEVEGGTRQGKRSRVRGDKETSGGGSSWLSGKDQAAADARKKRFAAS